MYRKIRTLSNQNDFWTFSIVKLQIENCIPDDMLLKHNEKLVMFSSAIIKVTSSLIFFLFVLRWHFTCAIVTARSSCFTENLNDKDPAIIKITIIFPHRSRFISKIKQASAWGEMWIYLRFFFGFHCWKRERDKVIEDVDEEDDAEWKSMKHSSWLYMRSNSSSNIDMQKSGKRWSEKLSKAGILSYLE